MPIWVVCVDGQVYVRTWHRRANGWYGRVLDSQRARTRVPGLEVDVTVRDVGEGADGLRSEEEFGPTGLALGPNAWIRRRRSVRSRTSAWSCRTAVKLALIRVIAARVTVSGGLSRLTI